MNKNCNEKIELIRTFDRSDFLNNLISDEFEDKIDYKHILKGYISIFKSYVYKNEDDMEIGIYIVNNSDTNILLKDFPIDICNCNSVIDKRFLKLNQMIKSKEALFKTVNIPLENVNTIKHTEDIYVKIPSNNSIDKYPYINIEIDNMPKVNGYKSYREGKKFLKSLSNIEENQFSIDLFKAGQVEEGFCIIALFRNSSSKAINIKSIPLTVLVSENLPVYKGVYNINDDGLIIESNKGKFYSIIIPLESFIQLDHEDMSKYIVKFE